MAYRAMILAAGKGTRLYPLTETTPKALLKFRGRPMIEHVLFALGKQGYTEIIINVHHHADQVIEYIRDNNFFGMEIHFSDEREELMDTGGGIMKAGWFLRENGPFIVHNVDIYSTLDLKELMHYHMENKPLATLAVSERKTSRNLLVDPHGELCGWRNNVDGTVKMVHDRPGLRPVAFSGIHIIDPSVFGLLKKEVPFSITDAYLELALDHRILVFEHPAELWVDMAKQAT